MVKKVLVDLCDEEIWEVVVVAVVAIHLIMVVAVVVVEVEVVEIEVLVVVHHGLHGIRMNIDPII
jgi:hypothetical protein